MVADPKFSSPSVAFAGNMPVPPFGALSRDGLIGPAGIGQNGSDACGGCSEAARCSSCGEPENSLEHQRMSWAQLAASSRDGVSLFWTIALVRDAYFGASEGWQPSPDS